MHPKQHNDDTLSQVPSREVAVAHGVKWHKLSHPKTWKPTEAGEEIVGYYLGQSVRDGQYSQYVVVLLAVPTGHGFTQPYVVSGTALISAIDAGQVEEGYLIRIVFGGMKDLGNGKNLKLFEVYVGEGELDEGIAADLFATIKTHTGKTEPRCSVCHQTGHNRRTCPEVP